MIDELELLRGLAVEHGRCLDAMADARRAKMSGDTPRHAQRIRDLRLSMEQRDALHGLWRRSYAPTPEPEPVVLPIRPVPAA